jgi:hypothetical protein
MKASPLPRKTADLSESIHQQLSMYALAASAAGVGALGLGQTAQAKIVYTPANVRIVANAGLVRIDLNHDGIADFGLSNRSIRQSFGTSQGLEVVPSREANEIWGAHTYSSSNQVLCAAALPGGTKVGPKGAFQQDSPGLFMAWYGKNGSHGRWLHVKQAYLGLKFLIKGKTHFGWARVKLDTRQRPFAATLTGYAYETIPGNSIIAGATKGPDDGGRAEQPSPAALAAPPPKPATLGLLAMGARGLAIWRREESVSVAR